MRLIKISIVFIMALFIIIGCEDHTKKETVLIKNSKPNNIISLVTISGKNINIKMKDKDDTRIKDLDFNTSKVVFLEFFQTTCQPCIAEIPHLNSLQKKFDDKLKIIAVHVGSASRVEIEDFIKKYEISYDVVVAGDIKKLFSQACEVTGTPEIYVYDSNTHYIKRYIGAVPQEMMENDLNQLLEDK